MLETFAALGVLGLVIVMVVFLYGKAQARMGAAKAATKVMSESAKSQKRFKDAKKKSAARTRADRLKRMRDRSRDR